MKTDLVDRMTHPAVLYVPPASDLDDGERVDLFDRLVAFSRWCQRHGYTEDIRTLPADPEGHAAKRMEQRGGPTVEDPNRPYCKRDQSCDFVCGN